MEPTGKKDIVIVGGGGAGAPIARALSQQLDAQTHSITLIESREFFWYLPGTLRLAVSAEAHLEERVLIPFEKLFHNGNGKVVKGTLASITPTKGTAGGHVTTTSGEEHHYDVLVLATGSSWEGPISAPDTKADTLKFVNEWRHKIKEASSIAIIGGGAVGCELSGEIRDVYPEKKISIIHRESHLLIPTYPDKFRIDVDKRWTQRHISLVLSDEVAEIPTDSTSPLITRKGASLDADLVIPCRGGKPNTAYMASLGNDVLTPAGRIKVDEHLQVKGFPGIFAAGDIIEWDEVKQFAKYAGHATVVVANVKDVLSGKAPTKVYKSMFELIALTNGANGGVTYANVLWGLTLGNWVTKTLKGKDLFITPTRKGMGLAE